MIKINTQVSLLCSSFSLSLLSYCLRLSINLTEWSIFSMMGSLCSWQWVNMELQGQETESWSFVQLCDWLGEKPNVAAYLPANKCTSFTMTLPLLLSLFWCATINSKTREYKSMLIWEGGIKCILRPWWPLLSNKPIKVRVKVHLFDSLPCIALQVHYASTSYTQHLKYKFLHASAAT